MKNLGDMMFCFVSLNLWNKVFYSRLYDPSQRIINVDIFDASQQVIIVYIIWPKSTGYNNWPYDPNQRVIIVDIWFCLS